MEESKNITMRRSIKGKNLEKEVALILSQDESDEEYAKCPNTRRRERQRKELESNVQEENVTVEVELSSNKRQTCLRSTHGSPKTPTTGRRNVNTESLRRSTRKSIMPHLDYGDIIENRTMSLALKVKNVVCSNNSECEQEKQNRWTSSEIGRVSMKRKGRKPKGKKLKITTEEEVINTEKQNEDIGEVVDVQHNNEEIIEHQEMPSLLVDDEYESKENNVNPGQMEQNVDSQQKLTLEDALKEPGYTKSGSLVACQNNNKDENEIGSLKTNENAVEIHKTSDQTPPVEFSDDNISQNQNDVDEKIETSIELIGLKDSNEETELIEYQQMPSLFVERDNDTNESFGKLDQLEFVVASEEEHSQAADILNVSSEISQNVENNTQSKSAYSATKEDNGMEANIENEKYFGEYLKAQSMDTSDLGLEPLDIDCNKEMKDMPSLLVCDDLEKDDSDIENELNATFDAGDSPSKKLIDTIKPDNENIMQALKVSEDEESKDENFKTTHVKFNMPIKILLTGADEEINSTLMNCNVPLPSTPKAARPKAYRFPTPYKNLKNEKSTEIVLRAENLPTMSYKDVVLRSIQKRKRSNSASSIPRAGATDSVTFYSPANKTACIDDIDKQIIGKITKKIELRNVFLNDSNVTKRKRSISMDDLSKDRIKVAAGPTSQKKVGGTRTKIPNFAAIHQKQFNQMENLVQHLERKAERAKLLSNSAIKLKTNSTQKSTLTQSGKKPENNETDEMRKKRLPDPRSARHLFPSSAAITQNQKKPLGVANVQTSSTKPIAQPLNSKGKAINFNFSTAILSTGKPNVLKPVNNFEDKTAARRQRHMEMFKGRSANKDSKRSDIIRGVRSNRRFELQMEHRKNIERHNV